LTESEGQVKRKAVKRKAW